MFEYLKEDEDKKERRNNLVILLIYGINESKSNIPRERNDEQMKMRVSVEDGFERMFR